MQSKYIPAQVWEIFKMCFTNNQERHFLATILQNKDWREVLKIFESESLISKTKTNIDYIIENMTA